MRLKAGVRRYFEGWYFKHQNGETVISLIPGLSVDSGGDSHAFIQVITADGAAYAAYDATRYRADHQSHSISVGESAFGPQGIALKIDKPGCRVQGSLRYGPLTPLRSDIMGPFAHLPGMECRHGIVSLAHPLQGELTVNGKACSFDGGLGYIERDWGRSFPQSYRWVQCAGPEQGGWCAFASAARIPYMGLRFTGCIAVLYHQGREHRFATYNGARADYQGNHGLTLRRGGSRLELTAAPTAAHQLKAPQMGQMSRVIHETVGCPVTVRLWEGDRLVFEGSSNHGGFEAIP